MYLTQVNKLRNIDKESFEILVLLSRLCKNMYNVGVYNVRQKFIFEGKYTNYFSNYHDCKYNENYKLKEEIARRNFLITQKDVDELKKSQEKLNKKLLKEKN